MKQALFCLFKLQAKQTTYEGHMSALPQQTLGPYGKVFLKFLSLRTHTVLNPLVRAPVTPQTSRGWTVSSSCDTEEHNCWCFQHPWMSPQVMTALCVPDTQSGTRTQPVGNKEVASVPVFTHCVHEAFILLYQLIYRSLKVLYKRKKTIKTCI